MKKQFKDIPEEIIKEIACLAFHSKEWVTSEIRVTYLPYIKEHFEDADEFFSANFEGYFAGNNTAFYTVQIRPSFDVSVWYSYKDQKNQILHCSNQSKIQELLNPYKP